MGDAARTPPLSGPTAPGRLQDGRSRRAGRGGRWRTARSGLDALLVVIGRGGGWLGQESRLPADRQTEDPPRANLGGVDMTEVVGDVFLEKRPASTCFFVLGERPKQ